MFDYLNKILFKTKGPDTENIQDDTEFQPFLVQRWSTMYSPEVTVIINQTSNTMWPVLSDKTMWFQYMHGVIPKCKFKRINYIKKKKDTDTVQGQKQTIQKIANKLEISSREVNLYIEQFNLDIPNEKK